jgi:hypothetical protein
MVKIQVRIVFLDEGVFLFHPVTNLVFDYNVPHNLVGKINLKDFKLIKTK